MISKLRTLLTCQTLVTGNGKYMSVQIDECSLSCSRLTVTSEELFEVLITRVHGYHKPWGG